MDEARRENPRIYKKLLELISEISKVTVFGCQKIQKSIAFLYFNIEQLETESLLKK